MQMAGLINIGQAIRRDGFVLGEEVYIFKQPRCNRSSREWRLCLGLLCYRGEMTTVLCWSWQFGVEEFVGCLGIEESGNSGGVLLRRLLVLNPKSTEY